MVKLYWNVEKNKVEAWKEAKNDEESEKSDLSKALIQNIKKMKIWVFFLKTI